MGNREINIRLSDEKDINRINDFHNKFHNDNRDVNKFNWEFNSAPAGKAIYVIAEDKESGSIVGTQAAILINLRDSDGRDIISAKSEDTLVDPGFRGLQIFERMYELLISGCKQQGVEYIWGFTSAQKPFRKIGFELPFSHGQSLMVFKIKPSFEYLVGLNPENSRLEKLKILFLTFYSKGYSMLPRLMSLNIAKTKAIISTRVDHDLNKVIGRITDKYEELYSINEDIYYLNWRINENPYHDQILSVSIVRDEDILASIIFNHHLNGIWYIVQTLFDERIKEREKARYLGFALRKLIEERSPVMIRTWTFNTNVININEIKLYRKSGFVHLNRGIFFVWKSLEGNNNLRPENFILSRMASQGVI
jgi:hypothetical protein